MGSDIAILLAIVLVLAVLGLPRLSGAPLWRATVTPLASIIGSGFLVIGPILDDAFGSWAMLPMAGLCAMAYGFGWSIRCNIARRAGCTPPGPAERALETVSAWVLAFAYVISVAYYLNLFGAFALPLAAPGGEPRLVTSGALVLIALVGLTRGFSALEGMEKLAVTVKLAIIAGLITGLALYFKDRAQAGLLAIDGARQTGWPAVALTLGLLVTVQGFETSRYLGEEYDPALRRRSMRLAQGVSALIYLVYIGLLSFSFPADSVPFSETAIIDMMSIVAPILPALLVAAALAAQFSAAVADTAGAGGLLAELTRGRIGVRMGYVLLVVIALALTWSANVFQIIAYASRAFALYYGLQSAIAALGAWQAGRTRRALGHAGFAALGLVIVLAGQAVAV